MNNDAREELYEMIENIGTAMPVIENGDDLRSRPMSGKLYPDSGEIWFPAASLSGKVQKSSQDMANPGKVVGSGTRTGTANIVLEQPDMGENRTVSMAWISDPDGALLPRDTKKGREIKIPRPFLIRFFNRPSDGPSKRRRSAPVQPLPQCSRSDCP